MRPGIPSHGQPGSLIQATLDFAALGTAIALGAAIGAASLAYETYQLRKYRAGARYS